MEETTRLVFCHSQWPMGQDCEAFLEVTTTRVKCNTKYIYDNGMLMVSSTYVYEGDGHLHLEYLIERIDDR